MPSSHLILCRPLLLLPPILPNIKVFSNESTLCMRWPKYWSFSFSIIPSKEISEMNVDVHSCHLLSDHFQLALIHGPIQVSMQYCSLQHQTLLPSSVTSTTGCCFCFGSVSSFFLEFSLHWSPVAYWTPTNLGSSSFSVLSFCLFIHAKKWNLYLKEIPASSCSLQHFSQDVGTT